MRSLARTWFEMQSRIDYTDTCWIWTGAKRSDDYGTVSRPRQYTHRVSYEVHYGPIPEGKVIAHLCRVHPCLRPTHLEAVAHGEHVLRGFNAPADNARKTHCKAGHPFNEVTTYWRKDGGRDCLVCVYKRQGHSQSARAQELAAFDH